jgi:crotonobetainyl-CoA:carnitine CoA-transferase CaiB-like acyl-CoA transferase
VTDGLSGIRVLDFGRYVAAPYCAMVLRDLGAEVIRVERPRGEDDRRLGLTAAHGESFMFVSFARGKKAITLDMRHGEAREVLQDLVAHCDVFLHNFAPAAAHAFGLTYDDIRAIRPDVVYAAISCYGTDGPYAQRIGFDPMAQVSSGAAALTGHDGHAPLRAGVPWVDYSTGLAAAVGILAALRHRDATGEGQAVDCALLRTAVSYTAPMVAEAHVARSERPRLGNQGAYVGPSNLYPCRDGYVYVTAITGTTWRSLAGLVGEPGLADEPELRTAEQRFDQRERLDSLITRWTGSQTVQEAVSALEGAHVPCGTYRSTSEVPDDPQVRAEFMLAYVDLEFAGLERVPVSVTPVHLSKVTTVPPTRPPRIGEHNDEVYRKLLGYDDDRLARLREEGAV